jgi:uncharacterized protein with HEPN domain
MREAADKIARFTEGKSRESLDRDELLYNALTWLFHVLGEAANHVSNAFRLEHDEIEWLDIIGFRNRIVHGYDSIDRDILWSIITRDLPGLRQALSKLDLRENR